MTDDDITEFLQEWSSGDPKALQQVVPLVADELRRLAGFHFQREAVGHTLQPTALVNELYLRLSSQIRVRFNSRGQFFSFASRLMRRILVDHHRARRTVKRGQARPKITFDDAIGFGGQPWLDLLELDDALENLGRFDPRMCRIVELRFFAGFTVPETAEALSISAASVKRDWATAKAFLARQLGPAS